jgi:hypothetical protein
MHCEQQLRSWPMSLYSGSDQLNSRARPTVSGDLTDRTRGANSWVVPERLSLSTFTLRHSKRLVKCLALFRALTRKNMSNDTASLALMTLEAALVTTHSGRPERPSVGRGSPDKFPDRALRWLLEPRWRGRCALTPVRSGRAGDLRAETSEPLAAGYGPIVVPRAIGGSAKTPRRPMIGL